MIRTSLTAVAVLFMTALIAAPAGAAWPPNRWGLEYSRPTRLPRASDPFVHVPPARIVPKRKPVPLPEAEVPLRPRYGRPKPAIERIPET